MMVGLKVKRIQMESKKHTGKLKKLFLIFLSVFTFFVFIFVFLFYGPIDSFKNFWITSAMTTMNHQYLATWLYSDKYIAEVLASNSVEEINEISDVNAIKFKKYTTSIYKNEYDKEILTKDSDNQLYKLIEVSGGSYKGFLVAIYDPSRIHNRRLLFSRRPPPTELHYTMPRRFYPA